MRRSIADRTNIFSVARGCALVVLAAVALGGCETTGSQPGPAAQAARGPMNHTQAAQECWMQTEKGRADTDLDKRAEYVTKCIDEKMNGAPPASGS